MPQTSAPKRIRYRRGMSMPPGAVYVGRPTKWGNPFKVGGDVDRAAAVQEFRKAFLSGLLSFTAEEVRNELRGRDLACWCPLDGGPCHANVLLEIANADLT